MSRILIVEDEEGLSGAIKEWLEDECYVVTVEYDGNLALNLMRASSFELIVLDIMLPGISGIEICKRYRHSGGITPILMLTAKTTMSAKEEGLDSGADDYLTKPFDMRELSARIRALLRRPQTTPTSVLEAGELKLDRNSRVVTRNGQTVKLLPKEFILLEVLMRHKGQLLSTDELIDHVWSSSSQITSDTVRSHVKSLRKKIDSAQIKTVHGMGYKIEDS